MLALPLHNIDMFYCFYFAIDWVDGYKSTACHFHSLFFPQHSVNLGSELIFGVVFALVSVFVLQIAVGACVVS